MTKLLIQTGSDEEEKRDIGTLALRAVLTEMPPSSPVAGDVVDKVIHNVVKQLASVRILSQMLQCQHLLADKTIHELHSRIFLHNMLSN